jgi:hypothetical protein
MPDRCGQLTRHRRPSARLVWIGRQGQDSALTADLQGGHQLSPGGPGQFKSVGQQPGRAEEWPSRAGALDITDRSKAQARPLGQFFLRQTGDRSVPAQKNAKSCLRPGLAAHVKLHVIVT